MEGKTTITNRIKRNTMPNIYVDTPDTKQGEEVKKKPILLVYCICSDNSAPELATAHSELSEYDHIRLIQKANSDLQYDIMQCWNNGVIITYLGHWNDGVIE